MEQESSWWARTCEKTREHVAKQITVGGLGPVLYGTAEQVADEIERWIEVSDVDGFNITYAVQPTTFEEVIEFLIPELQKRGLVWDDYPDIGRPLTFREQLFGVDRKDSSFCWKLIQLINWDGELVNRKRSLKQGWIRSVPMRRFELEYVFIEFVYDFWNNVDLLEVLLGSVFSWVKATWVTISTNPTSFE